MRKFALYILVMIVVFSCSDNSGSKTGITDTVFINEPDSSNTSTISIDTLVNEEPLMGKIICTEKIPIPPITIKKTIFFLKERGELDSSISYQVFTPEQALSQKLFTCKQFLWEKDTLQVMFIDDKADEIVKRRVLETAKKWEQYCSIVFQFGNFSNPDITISFRYGVNESCIGNTSRYKTPSLTLTGLRQNSTQEVYDKFVLHEFGHALGLFHEHMNPNANIPWNIPFLNEYYKKPPNNWTPYDVKVNIVDKPPYTNCLSSKFDQQSIMIYEILPDMVKNPKFVTKAGSKISTLDIENIQNLYPK